MSDLAAAGAAAVVVAAVLGHAYWWPYQPCPHCQGRRGRGVGSTSEAWNRCHWCGGKGERVRRISRIYPKRRAESRKQRRK